MWTLSGMEIQRHPSHYANAAQWLRYSNVSHPGDVEELTQTEQGGGNTEGSGDRTGELLLRQALPHTHTHTHTHTHGGSNNKKQTRLLSECTCSFTHTHTLLLICAPADQKYTHAGANIQQTTYKAEFAECCHTTRRCPLFQTYAVKLTAEVLKQTNCIILRLSCASFTYKTNKHYFPKMPQKSSVLTQRKNTSCMIDSWNGKCDHLRSTWMQH